MYRKIGSAHALGELDDGAAAQAFLELAADLRMSDRDLVSTIIVAIEHDVEQLAPPNRRAEPPGPEVVGAAWSHARPSIHPLD